LHYTKENIMPYWWRSRSFIFIALCVLLSALLQGAMLQLRYEHVLLDIQPWRMVTAHWVHLGWRHYALNMLAFLFIPYLFPQFSIRSLIACLLLLSMFISLCFYWFMPYLVDYTGLSGVLHGMYVLAALQSLSYPKLRKFGLLVLGCIVVKLSWEQLFGSESAAFIQAPVIIQAHQFGVLGGMLFAAIDSLYCQLKRTSR
jgi:rhomboid family GlyGly-CTERM serine protease